LNDVRRIVERKVTIPITSNVVLEGQGDMLTLTATDLDMEARRTIKAQVDVEGATSVPAHLFGAMVAKLPKGSQVQIEHTDKNFMAITSGRRLSRLASLPAEDFPRLGADATAKDMPHSITLPGHILHDALAAGAYAMSNSEAKFSLNGTFMETGVDDWINLISTDGHRMAMVQIHDVAVDVGGKTKKAKPPQIIIHRKAVHEIMKLVHKMDRMVTLSWNDSKLHLALPDGQLFSKLVDGQFPEYRRAIPKANDKVVQGSREKLAEGAAYIAPLTEAKSTAVKLTMDKDMLQIFTRNENGDAQDELTVTYEGDPFHMGVSGSYLSEVLNHLQSDEVSIAFGEATSALVIRPVGDGTQTHILQPMSIKF